MQIVKLMGGLGNQMFQYAFGKALGHETLFDLIWFEKVKNAVHGTLRSLKLDVFNCSLPLAGETERALFDFTRPRSRWERVIRRLYGDQRYYKKYAIIVEKQEHVFDPCLLEPIDKGYYVGYFQTDRYFSHLRNSLLKEFTLKDELNDANLDMMHNMQGKNTISLHIRRGDYVHNEITNYNRGLCSLDYYYKAIRYITDRVSDPHFFVFSDDMEWVKHNLTIRHTYTNVDINDARTDYYDLWLMKHCRHNIIANSSFSWWGAWLNENTNKIVIAPKVWTANRKINNRDVIPSQWVCM